MQPVKPKHVGTWVLACTPEGDFIKWGKDGDTEFPFPPDDVQAAALVECLAGSPTHAQDRLFVLHLFDNGQMKQFEADNTHHRQDQKP